VTTEIYITIIPCFLWACNFVTLREEHWLRVSENRVLRKVYGRKRDEVTGEWRNCHSEELLDLFSSQNILVNKWKRLS
jgi:hypothetical protein